MTRTATIYLNDILEYMERAENYVRGMSFQAFSNGLRTSDAVIRCLEVIGEATNLQRKVLRGEL